MPNSNVRNENENGNPRASGVEKMAIKRMGSQRAQHFVEPSQVHQSAALTRECQ